MRFAAAVLATIAVFACTSSPTEPPKTVESTVTLHYAESVTAYGVTLAFADIDDSRCPTSVTCVWAGDAAVRLQSGTQSLVLHSNTAAGAGTGSLAGLTITLTDVKPVPVTAGALKKTDYVITLRVSR